MRKWHCSNPRNEWESGTSVSGAINLDHLQPFKSILTLTIVTLSYLNTGRPIPITPRGLKVRKRNSLNSRSGWDRGIWVTGPFEVDYMQPLKPILFWQFSICLTVTLGANSYYPKGLIMTKGISANSRNGWVSFVFQAEISTILEATKVLIDKQTCRLYYRPLTICNMSHLYSITPKG